RHCRTMRWRTRAGSAPSRALDRVWRDRASCSPIILFAQPANQVGDMLRHAFILFAQPANQVGNMLRHAFADDVVVHCAQLLPDTRLNLAPEAHLALALCDRPTHCLPGFRLVLIRSRRLDVHCLTGVHFSSCPHYHRRPEFRMVFPRSLATNAWLGRWFRPRELFLGTMFAWRRCSR